MGACRSEDGLGFPRRPGPSRCRGAAEDRHAHEPRGATLSTVATILPLAASGEGNGFHAPSIAEFFPDAIWFAGTPFEINRIVMVRLVTAAALVVVMVVAARRAKVVPGRGQNVIEMGLDFVRVNIAEEILGHNAKRFVAMLTTIFFSILVFNLTGVVPLLNISSTALIGMPIVMRRLGLPHVPVVRGEQVRGGRVPEEQPVPAGPAVVPVHPGHADRGPPGLPVPARRRSHCDSPRT